MFFLSFVLFLGATHSSVPLDLETFYRLEVSASQRFDLSGALFLSDELKAAYKLEYFDLVLVSDQSSWVYRGRISGPHEIKVEPWRRVLKNWGVRYDFEDLEVKDGRLFVLNEGDGALIELLPEGGETIHRWKVPETNLAFTDWFGAEALSVFKNQFWVFREMPPLASFLISKKGVKTLKTDREGSQTAARYREGLLYILDRDRRCVWVMKEYFKNPLCWDFSQTVDEDPRFRFRVIDFEGKLHPEWSTAEALELRDGKVWIGLDNNGQALFSDAKETRPVFLVFSQP